jgi:hypothetical protein
LPINFAIEYGAFSIVDLLLKNGAVLDSEFLDYTNKSVNIIGNSEMEKYVRELWEIQCSDDV